MGRNLTIKKYRITAALLGLPVIACLLTWGTQTPVQMAFAQTIPAMSESRPLARDAGTFEDDKRLNRACRSRTDLRGRNTQEACLCVTHIIKYELTIAEYRAMVALYGTTGNREPIYKTLRDTGLQAGDINVAEHVEDNLLTASDFSERCEIAKTYYQSSKG